MNAQPGEFHLDIALVTRSFPPVPEGLVETPYADLLGEHGLQVMVNEEVEARTTNAPLAVHLLPEAAFAMLRFRCFSFVVFLPPFLVQTVGVLVLSTGAHEDKVADEIRGQERFTACI